jgi:hypothetical protein
MTRGLISELDAQTIEATLRLIVDEFPRETIHVTEVGLFNCATSIGIHDKLKQLNTDVIFTGIDNEKDKPITSFPQWMKLIIGNSNEAYYQLKDRSQHFIFIDANHSFSYVVSDFFCYSDKVKLGGYMTFHDTGRHIKPLSGYQSGSYDNPDSYIAVRKALKKIGLLDDKFEGWRLAFDRADETDEMGGIVVIKRIA